MTKMDYGKFVTDVSQFQKMYICDKALIVDKAVNWRHNRPADATRIDAIKKHYVDSEKSFLDGVVYAWDDGQTLHIYDGWNRYSAASPLMKFLLCVSTNTSEDAIKREFLILNSAVSVPEIYGHDSEKQFVWKRIVEKFDTEFGALKKPSKNPRAPHYNRDNFMQMLCDLDIKLEDFTEEELWAGISSANHEISQYRIKFHEKAVFHKMYLFALKDTNKPKLLKDHILKQKQKASFVSRLFR